MNKPRVIIATVAGLTAVTVALWLTVLRPEAPQPDPAADAAQAAAAALAKVPAALRIRPAQVTANVRLAAQQLPRDVAALTAELALPPAALPARDPLADAPDAPRSADRLAGAFTGAAPVAASPFERATLAAALLKAAGAKHVDYGWIPGGRHAATQVIARRYAIRVAGGPWYALDPAPFDPRTIRPLDEVGFIAQTLTFRALGAMKAGDADAASAAANHARRLAPDDPAVTFVVALTQINRGLIDMGVATMERAANSAADGLTWYTLGRLAQARDEAFRADRLFRKAVEADPRFVNPRVALAELAIDRLAVTPESQHPAIIAQAREHLASARAIDNRAAGIRVIQANLAAITEDLPLAEQLLRDEARLHPAREDGWLYLAQLLALQARDAEALATMRAALEAGVDTPDALKTHAVLAASAGHWDEARESLERSIARAPDDVEVRPQLAQLYRGQGRVEDARRALAEQVARFPDDVTALLLLSQLEMDDKRWDQAFAALDKALDKAPDHKEAAMLDYVGRLASGRPIDASRDRAVRIVGSHREIAQYLLEQDLDAAAEAHLRASFDEEPEDPIAPILLYGLYQRDGRVQQAKALRDETFERYDERDHGELVKLFAEALEQVTPRPAPTPAPAAAADPSPAGPR